MKINKNIVFDSIIMILIFLEYSYIIAFYSFVIRARIALSRWPSYENPDPKLLHFDYHREVVMPYSFDISTLSICIIFLLFLISKFFRAKISRIYYYLYFSGIFLLIYIIIFDPFMEWYAD